MQSNEARLLIHVDNSNMNQFPGDYEPVWKEWLSRKDTIVIPPGMSIFWDFDPFDIEACLELPTTLYIGGQLLHNCIKNTLLKLSRLHSVVNCDIKPVIVKNACYAERDPNGFYRGEIKSLRRKIPQLEVIEYL